MSMRQAKVPDAPELEVAWAAGFLDGEGTFDLARKAGGYAALRVRAGQVELAPLRRLQDALGGKVYGPYPVRSRPQSRPYAKWEAGVAAIERVFPYLSAPKQAQVTAARERLAVLRAARPSRGLAAVNAAKTECPKGHPYDEENTYYRPDGSRACRTCHREGEQRRRAARRGGSPAGE